MPTFLPPVIPKNSRLPGARFGNLFSDLSLSLLLLLLLPLLVGSLASILSDPPSMALAPNHLLAQVTFDLTGPGIVSTKATGVTNLEKLISQVIGILTIVGVIYFAVQIILAGYSMLSSEGDPKKIEMSRDRLTQSVLGLFVVVIAIIIAALVARLAGIQNALDLEAMFTLLKL